MTDNLKDLFPTPSLSPSKLSPNTWPGIDHESTKTLTTVLKDNHKKWHLFFNDKRFHNHAAHYALALWALGADGDIIKAAYDVDCKYQRAAFKSPEAITTENFKDHLGDDNYYEAYMNFYKDAIKGQDLWDVLEKYIFDAKANFGGPGDKQPAMLDRFLDGLLHPIIHAGYGVEFGLPGMIVEALASTAVHQTNSGALLPASLWGDNLVDSLTSKLPSMLKSDKSLPASKNTHALTILARILADPRFDVIEQRYDMGIYTRIVEQHVEALQKYVSEWTFDRSDPKEVERKIEELVWANVVIYGIGGWTKGEAFNADFFYMHLVTSSLFLSSLVTRLKPASQELLLRSYFSVCLTWWIGRGRPGFDISGFFAETSYPTPPGPFPPPHKQALPSVTSPKATTPNPWFPIIQASLVIPEDHVPKLQRALAHYGALYGTRAPGQPDFAETELPFAEKLDGTLFIRVASLTNTRVNRDVAVVDAGVWDRKGFENIS